MAKVDLTVKEMNAILHWAECSIGMAESADEEDYSEAWCDLLGVLHKKLTEAREKDLDALIETIRTS